MRLVILLFFQRVNEVKQFLFLIFPSASVFGDGILQVVQFFKRMFDVLFADRFQQVVDTVHFEGTQGIFVVSRGEDNGAGDADMIEYFESRTIRQVNIHKNEFRHRVDAEPFDGGIDAVQYGNNFSFRFHFVEQGSQIAYSSFFIFNNNCFHNTWLVVHCTSSIRGMQTENSLSSVICMSCLNNSR